MRRAEGGLLASPSLSILPHFHTSRHGKFNYNSDETNLKALVEITIFLRQPDQRLISLPSTYGMRCKQSNSTMLRLRVKAR